MKIEHLAIWTKDLERLKNFYVQDFQATPGSLYHNPVRNFTSYFLSFQSGCRLELMQMPGIPQSRNDLYRQATGINHIAFSTGSKQAVDALTDCLRNDGYEIVGEPRTTGDGYYESVVLDPDGNRLEITE